MAGKVPAPFSACGLPHALLAVLRFKKNLFSRRLLEEVFRCHSSPLSPKIPALLEEAPSRRSPLLVLVSAQRGRPFRGAEKRQKQRKISENHAFLCVFLAFFEEFPRVFYYKEERKPTPPMRSLVGLSALSRRSMNDGSHLFHKGVLSSSQIKTPFSYLQRRRGSFLKCSRLWHSKHNASRFSKFNDMLGSR